MDLRQKNCCTSNFSIEISKIIFFLYDDPNLKGKNYLFYIKNHFGRK